MTDYSKLSIRDLNIEINKVINPSHTYGEDHRGWWQWDGKTREVQSLSGYHCDDRFCFAVLKELKIEPQHKNRMWECRIWRKSTPVPCYAKNKDLNRAILECYLQFKNEQAVDNE